MIVKFGLSGQVSFCVKYTLYLGIGAKWSRTSKKIRLPDIPYTNQSNF